MLEKIIFSVLFGLVVMLFALGGMAIYVDVTAERYSIRKDQWTCDKTEPTRVLTMAGKVPVWTTRDECVLYRKTDH